MDMELLRTRAIILVANKIDLARSRAVSSQGKRDFMYNSNQIRLIEYFFVNIYIDGKCLACTFRAKFIEVSVGINHNVDELLAGILTQIRLKQEHNILQVTIISFRHFQNTTRNIYPKNRSHRVDETVHPHTGTKVEVSSEPAWRRVKWSPGYWAKRTASLKTARIYKFCEAEAVVIAHIAYIYNI